MGDDRLIEEYAKGFTENLKARQGAMPLLAESFAEVAVEGCRMWRTDGRTDFDLVLPADSMVWLVVPHTFQLMPPPGLGARYAAGDRRMVFNALLLAGGAVVPRSFPGFEDLERLVKQDPRDTEIARLRAIIERNKTKYLELQRVCKHQRAKLAEAQVELSRAVADTDEVREMVRKLKQNMSPIGRGDVIDAGEA